MLYSINGRGMTPWPLKELKVVKEKEFELYILR
jgi:hypothetical protein